MKSSPTQVADEYVERLKILAEMIKNASTRIGLAMCNREDMQTLFELAKNGSDEARTQ
jgi:hypothetical protein